MRRRQAGLPLGALLAVPSISVLAAVGCTAPHARFLSTSCEPVQRNGELEAIAFTSSIETRGLAGQQLIYGVGLINSRLKPIPSSNRRFRNRVGNVAASKALLVYRSPWTVENVRVVIPVEELEVRAEDLPALAEFGISRADGSVLAREVAVLPLYQATKGLTGPYARTGRAPQMAEPGKPPDKSLRHPGARGARPGPTEGRSPPRDVFTLLVEEVERLSAELESPTRDEWLWVWPRATAAEWLARRLAGWLEAGEKAPQSQPASGPTAATGHRPTAGPPADSSSTSDEELPYRHYVVRRGDTLSGIARRLLNDETRWIEIFQLNRDRLKSPQRLRPGTVLRLPPVVAESEEEN